MSGGRPPIAKPRGNDAFARRTWKFVEREMRRLKVARHQLAEIAGVSKSAISRWSDGVNAPPLDALSRIAKHFDISLDVLVGNETRAPALEGLRRVEGVEEAILDLYERNTRFRKIVTELLAQFSGPEAK